MADNPLSMTLRETASLAREVAAMGGEVLAPLRRCQVMARDENGAVWAVAKLVETEDGRWRWDVESRFCRRGKGGVSIGSGLCEFPQEALAMIRVALASMKPKSPLEGTT